MSASLTDLLLERVALGQQLLASHRVNGAALYAGAGIRPEHFTLRAHVYVQEAIAEVQRGGGQPDLVSVGEVLRRRAQLEEVNAAYFAGLVDGVPVAHPANVPALVGRLDTLRVGRLVAVAGRALASHVTEEPEGLEDGTVAERLASLQVAVCDRLRSACLDAPAQWAAIEADIRTEADRHIWTGWPTIDQCFGGIRPGEVCGIMARTFTGKTWALTNIAARMADDPIGQVFFSLEMPPAQIATRLACHVFGVSRAQLAARIADADLPGDRYLETYQHLVIDGTSGLTVEQMGGEIARQQATRFSQEVPLRVVYVDHLGFIGGDTRLSAYDRVSKQARDLKTLAKRYHVAVIVAIQVNREATGDGTKRLTFGSARDSGQIEEAMDYLLGFRRFDRSEEVPLAHRETLKDVLFAAVIKSRHAVPADEVALRFDPASGRLTETEGLKPWERGSVRF